MFIFYYFFLLINFKSIRIIIVVLIANLFVFGFKFLKFTESKYLSVVTFG